MPSSKMELKPCPFCGERPGLKLTCGIIGLTGMKRRRIPNVMNNAVLIIC